MQNINEYELCYSCILIVGKSALFVLHILLIIKQFD